ncbi:hypothetical protein JW935_20100 [candidate division KSB1 bacterium]|nr:hypothetical protein [candidate division KSB1 bacterium]
MKRTVFTCVVLFLNVGEGKTQSHSQYYTGICFANPAVINLVLGRERGGHCVDVSGIYLGDDRVSRYAGWGFQLNYCKEFRKFSDGLALSYVFCYGQTGKKSDYIFDYLGAGIRATGGYVYIQICPGIFHHLGQHNFDWSASAQLGLVLRL